MMIGKIEHSLVYPIVSIVGDVLSEPTCNYLKLVAILYMIVQLASNGGGFALLSYG